MTSCSWSINGLDGRREDGLGDARVRMLAENIRGRLIVSANSCVRRPNGVVSGALNRTAVDVADEDGLGRADRWLHSIEARGGTEASPALAAALDLLERHNKGRRARWRSCSSRMAPLETKALCSKECRENRAIRLFAVGVDTAISQGFLANLARVGRGTSTFVAPERRSRTRWCR